MMNILHIHRLMALALTGLGASAAVGAVPAPDAIYLNGKIVTVDPKFSIAQGFALSGEKFVAVGKNARIRKLAGPATTVIDLGGRTVLPGFVDTHAHVIARALYPFPYIPAPASAAPTHEARAHPSLAGVRSVAEIAQRIAESAAQAPPGAWIVTSPIGEPPDYFNLPESLAEKRWPTRADLDKAAPNNPVFIPTNYAWPYPAIFNSLALALLEVSRDTPDAPSIRIVKDPATGEPTGVLYGVHLFNPVPIYRKLMSLLPPPSPEEQQELIARVLEDNLAVGVTTVYEAHGNSSPPRLHLYLQNLKSAGQPTGRVVSAYELPRGKPIAESEAWMNGLVEARGAGTGDDYFKIVGVTASLDGGPHFGTAFMSHPYLDPYGQPTTGFTSLSTAQLTDIARLAVKYHLRLNVVASGDKACATVVEAFEAVNREAPIKDRQWVAQHFHEATREQIVKLKELGVGVETYSNVDWSRGAETYIKRFPRQDVWKSVAPYRWWIDADVTVAQASDAIHTDPMFTLWESLVRVDGRTGRSLLTPPKTITRQEAIRIYTINGARLLQWGDRIGSIEAGKYADFVVLDHDILTVPVERIRGTRAVLTAVGGKTVYGALPPAGAAGRERR